ncbi:MAG: hypothetical protein HFG99_07755 [Dorea sp.]|jgi:hypothetical protein|nr:hypothetical protein [Dorea sp.]MCI9249029.1 hypothetical protein [Dorea sp.]
MIILNLKTKNFMQHLLLKPTFDAFSLIEGEVTTYNTFKIDGYIHKNFFEDAPPAEYSLWADLRDFCFQIIRGKRTPLAFKFVLSLPKERFEDFLSGQGVTGIVSSDIQGMYINIRYSGSLLQCATGISFKSFVMDKTLDGIWDSYVKKFFLNHEIDFE